MIPSSKCNYKRIKILRLERNTQVLFVTPSCRWLLSHESMTLKGLFLTYCVVSVFCLISLFIFCFAFFAFRPELFLFSLLCFCAHHVSCFSLRHWLWMSLAPLCLPDLCYGLGLFGSTQNKHQNVLRSNIQVPQAVPWLIQTWFNVTQSKQRQVSRFISLQLGFLKPWLVRFKRYD